MYQCSSLQAQENALCVLSDVVGMPIVVLEEVFGYPARGAEAPLQVIQTSSYKEA